LDYIQTKVGKREFKTIIDKVVPIIEKLGNLKNLVVKRITGLYFDPQSWQKIDW